VLRKGEGSANWPKRRGAKGIITREGSFRRYCVGGAGEGLQKGRQTALSAWASKEDLFLIEGIGGWARGEMTSSAMWRMGLRKPQSLRKATVLLGPRRGGA